MGLRMEPMETYPDSLGISAAQWWGRTFGPPPHSPMDGYDRGSIHVPLYRAEPGPIILGSAFEIGDNVALKILRC